MTDRFFLKTLGPPEFMGADGPPIRFKVRKHLALLIYLAVDHRGVHTRDALVELFWGDVGVERGRHSLSVALSVLRSVLGSQAIRSTNTHVRLVRSNVTLDLDLLARGAILGGEGFPPIEVDRFLLDWEIDDSPAFQHWRDRQYARLLPALQTAFLTLIDHARRSGDMPRILVLSERLLLLDPLSEEGIRARMTALAMQGDRVGALRAYEEWKRELSRQLGAQPSELLESIASRLRSRNGERAIPAPDPVAPVRREQKMQFVGRAAEFRELMHAWEATTQFDTRHILLTGESGIGKSTLAMRFGAAVALEGAAVARVQCFELEQRIAFGMIGALVTGLLDKPGAVATAPAALAEIARVIPGIRERFPNLPAAPRTEGETARVHFAEGIFALFDAIMDEQPLLLIVDDYPRSDEASLSVLHMLLRRAGTDRAMVVLTGRPPEAGESAQVRRIREGISYLPMRHIQLAHLTEEEGDSMLGALLNGNGKEVIAPIRRAILQAGRGNPMALDLLAQDWLAHGEAALAIALPAMSSDMPASALEAVGYDRLIERMLPDLPPRTRAALQLAILGPRLNDLECFDIAALTPAQTLAAMTDLVERRLLRDVEGRLEFTNELIRARLYLKIPSAARIRMHDGVANRLLVAAAVGESVPRLEIAWHCIRAKRRDEATPFLMGGARDAILHGAPDEAVRALSSALGHLKGRARVEAAVLLAESYQEMGEWKEALECLQEFPGGKKSADHLYAMAYLLGLESRRALEMLPMEEMSSIAGELAARAENDKENTTIRVYSALTAARMAGTLAESSLLESVSLSTEAISTNGMDGPLRTKLLLANGYAQYQLRRNEAGHRKTLAGARLLEEAGAADTTFVSIQIGLGAYEHMRGAYAEGIPHFKKAFHAAVRLDNSSLISSAACNLALGAYRLGQPYDMIEWARIAECYSSARHPGSSNRVGAAAYRGIGSLYLGKTRDVSAAQAQLRAAKKRADCYWTYQNAAYFEADLHWLLGAKNAAFETIVDAWGRNQIPPASGYEGKFARWKTLFLLEEGRTPEAHDILEHYFDQIERLDLFDQAEILCSMELVRRIEGVMHSKATEKAREVLARLPIPCSRQLEEFGLRLPN